MEDVIHLLPDSVANQIAAGEVVQRPSSIVKELVENSLDAGARNIQVIVTDGGRTCVQVIDDGKGMSETDARLAFERHATSKISTAADLFTLTTMGFRGEALASIAAVAQVELKTRRSCDELGTRILIAGSKIDLQELVVCSVGCNLAVKNIFFNIPARRKFLKSNQTELSNIITDFERIVLTHPEVAFSLSNNGVQIHRLAVSSMRQRIFDVYGKKLNTELIPVEVETSLITVRGYVAKPESSKKRGNHQFFFVNGRYMRHPYFHSAVMHSYENIIPVGEQVSYFIYLSVDPSAIDVNVHPTKTEIKFDNEQAIWQVLTATVREALGKFSGIPTIDFDTADRPYIPTMMNGAEHPDVERPQIVQSDYNPFTAPAKHSYTTHNNSSWQTLYPDLADSDKRDIQTALWQEKEEDPIDLSAPRFQYKGRYIVMPVTAGLMIVDQRRAHICVLYQQYLESLSQQQGVSQGLLFPELVQFTKQEAIILDNMLTDIEYIGFELTNLGGGAYSLTGVPSGIDGVNPSDLLHDLVVSAAETGRVKQKLHHSIALTMARAVAFVYGQVLSDDEINLLFQQLFALPSHGYTPDGHRVYSVIADTEINRPFK